MRAFLLASGLGTRLRPLTDSIPKCLVEIAGKPLMQYWLEALINAGVEKILVNTHYRSGQVEEFIAQSGFSEYVELRYEAELLGTLGSIRAHQDFFSGERTCIAHADNFTDANLSDFFRCHQTRPGHCNMTMLLFNTSTPESCGICGVDEAGVLNRYVEKPATETFGNMANSALFVFEKAAIDEMLCLDSSKNDLCKDYLPTKVGSAFTYFYSGNFIDIGTPETLQEAQRIAGNRCD